MMAEKSSGFILISDNFHNLHFSVLLLHYKSGHWDFPKGNIESNETEIQAATRELREETNITKFRLIPNFRYILSYKYTRKSILISKQVILFLASTNIIAVKISDEHIGYKWTDISASTNQLTYSNAKKALLYAINFIQKLPPNINY
jgi:8-oxo-dGTP pyrophosphatase MutT (NUDIX family)